MQRCPQIAAVIASDTSTVRRHYPVAAKTRARFPCRKEGEIMAYAITSQKRGGYIRAIIATFETADEALDDLAMHCSEELMDSFTPGDALLPLRDKTLRAEIIREDDIARGWTLHFPCQIITAER